MHLTLKPLSIADLLITVLLLLADEAKIVSSVPYRVILPYRVIRKGQEQATYIPIWSIVKEIV